MSTPTTARQRGDLAGLPARPRIGNRRSWLLLLPGLVVIFVFFVLPYANMLYISFLTRAYDEPYYHVPTLENYAQVLSDAFNWEIIGITFMFAMVSSVVTLAISYPVAYYMARSPSRRKGILMALVLAPLLVGVVVRSYGWMILLADTGLVNQFLEWIGVGPRRLMYNMTGVWIGLIHVYLPFMVISLMNAISDIDPELEKASRSLGASAWTTFRRVVWPLSLPGVAAGSVLVFVLAVSAYVIPSLLGGYNVLTAPLLIVQAVMDLFNWPMGSALAMVLFVATVGAIVIFNRIMARAMKGVA
jgi:putative spermidine/putrescine transport system permease protein